ncbi:MAG: UvrD-helicase domain-containing protein [Erysipelotrichaceae bacterium]
MTKWNSEQTKAIETTNKNVLVSASAGAGKTTVLIARLVRIVMQERVGIDRILAMTFTEAAANEMKKRLNDALSKQYETCQEPQERVYLQEQLSLLQKANISTIHSFCLSIIQNYYYVIDLEPKRANTILDSAMTALYEKQAMAFVLKQCYEESHPDFVALQRYFEPMPGNSDTLEQAIRTLATLANTKAEPFAWLDQMQRVYAPKSALSQLPEAIQSLFAQAILIQLPPYQKALQELHDFMLSYDPNKLDYLGIIDQKLQIANQLLAQPAFDYTHFKEQWLQCVKLTLKSKPRGSGDTYKVLADIVKETEDALLADLFDERKFLHDFTLLYPIVTQLVTLTTQFMQAYDDIKKQEQVIDFSDMEHFALAILKAQDGWVASLYREQFYEIMVDEFQDSNDVQDELVSLIKKENNVFRVGDIKQSIYGFRYAKPDLMRSLIEQAGEQDEVIYLANNYRSKTAIIEFNNFLFDQLMNLDGFASSYSQYDAVKSGIPSQDLDQVPIHFHALNKKTIDPDNVRHSDEFKADYIVNHIITKKMTDSKARWKDFVVLVRSNNKKEVLRKQFERYHVPCFVDVKSGFFQSSAVQLCLSLLRLLINNQDAISLCAIVNSPLYPKGLEHLGYLRFQKETSYYHAMRQQEDPLILFLDDLRKQLDVLAIHEILNRIFDYEAFYHLFTNDQDKTNLDLLFQKAIHFEQEGDGLDAFLAFIEQIQDEKTAEAIPIGFDADVVRVMSIHQSKGLQFPCVYLWSSSRMMKMENKEMMMVDEQLGLGLKCFDVENGTISKTLPRLAIEFKKDKEELEEEMRILYVATTRAQNEMHIVDLVEDLAPYEKPLTPSSIFARKGYTSWILGAFHQIQPHLFLRSTIDAPWKIQRLPASQTPNKALPITPKLHPTTQYLTPTKQKVTPLNPVLAFNKTQYGFVIGNAMHAMVERLPNEPWDEALIAQTANELRFNIAPAQVTQLLALSQNPLFQDLQKQEISKELDFMVKTQEGIINGVMDYVAVGEHVTLIDFKSDAHLSAAQLLQLYTPQLQSYGQALHYMYPTHTIKTYLYSFAHNAFIEVVHGA